MKIPFVRDLPEFKPRPHIGQPLDLPKLQQDVINAIDVLEQKADFCVDLAVKAYNGVLILIAITICLQGPAVVKLIQGWLGAK